MRHHLRRAKHVYETRGLKEVIESAVTYIPIEINNFVFRARHGSGTMVMKEDWDTLILLDACRYDMFAERVPFDGRLEARISKGSTSEEFLRQNFEDGQFHDTVYVNANVYFSKLGLDQDETFHAVIDLLDEWDEDLEIAHPETVTNAAIRAHEQYPDKRIIVHYMQPHLPFIGPRGLEIRNKLGQRNGWIPLRNGKSPVSLDEFWEGYNENLDIAFEYVAELLSEVDGRIVISADHGNMVGERQSPIPTKRRYGHPWGVYTEELVKVPWFVIQGDERRETVEDPPMTSGRQAKPDELVEQRLKTLGYK